MYNIMACNLHVHVIKMDLSLKHANTNVHDSTPREDGLHVHTSTYCLLVIHKMSLSISWLLILPNSTSCTAYFNFTLYLQRNFKQVPTIVAELLSNWNRLCLTELNKPQLQQRITRLHAVYFIKALSRFISAFYVISPPLKGAILC